MKILGVASLLFFILSSAYGQEVILKVGTCVPVEIYTDNHFDFDPSFQYGSYNAYRLAVVKEVDGEVQTKFLRFDFKWYQFFQDNDNYQSYISKQFLMKCEEKRTELLNIQEYQTVSSKK